MDIGLNLLLTIKVTKRLMADAKSPISDSDVYANLHYALLTCTKRSDRYCWNNFYPCYTHIDQHY